MRKIFRGVAVVVGTAVAMVTAVAPAHADAVSARPNAAALPTGWYYLENVGTGKFLEVKDGLTANDTPVVQDWQGVGDQDQAWRLTESSNGKYAIRNAADPSWKAISMTGGGTGNGVKAIEYTFIDSSTNEQWTPTSVAGHTNEYTFINNNSKKCLEIQGGNESPGFQADQWSCNNAGNTMWLLVSWP